MSAWFSSAMVIIRLGFLFFFAPTIFGQVLRKEQCSACKAVFRELGNAITKANAASSPELKSLNSPGASGWKYELSEIAALDSLTAACKGLLYYGRRKIGEKTEFVLVANDNGPFDLLQTGDPYEFAKVMGSDTNDLKLYCNRIVENHDTQLLNLFKSQPNFEAMLQPFCQGVVNVCKGEDAVELEVRKKRKPKKRLTAEEKKTEQLRKNLKKARKKLLTLESAKEEKVISFYGFMFDVTSFIRFMRGRRRLRTSPALR